uniref:Integrase catalytic domain-containing protein n=1 Tax=Strongyloides stercoralis TaxID=6248 RepID=A0A0K0EG10_STRER
MKRKSIQLTEQDLYIIDIKYPLVLGKNALREFRYCVAPKPQKSEMTLNVGNKDELQLKQLISKHVPEVISKSKYDLEIPSFKRFDATPDLTSELLQQAKEFKKIQVIQPSYNFGLPKEIHSDNVRCFSAGVFKKWCDENYINLSHSIKYNHKTNVHVERSLYSLQQAIRKSSFEKNSNIWMKDLKKIVFNINNTAFIGRDYTLQMLTFNFQPRTKLDNKKNITLIQDCGSARELHKIIKEVQILPTKQIVFKNNFKKGKLSQQNHKGKILKENNSNSDHPTWEVMPDKKNGDQRAKQLVYLLKLIEK